MKKKALVKQLASRDNRIAELQEIIASEREDRRVAKQTLAVIRQVLGPEPLSMTTSAITEGDPPPVILKGGTWTPRSRPPFQFQSTAGIVTPIFGNQASA